MAKRPMPDFVTLIERKDHRSMPWKNGGGITSEIAIEPNGASLSDAAFHWRLSVARMDRAGPFSRFPGCERWLVVTSGGALSLDFVSSGRTELLKRGKCLRFSGEEAVNGSLPSGAIEDFNVIWRPEAADVTMQSLDFRGHVRSFKLKPRLVFLLALEHFQVSLFPGEHRFKLRPGDVLRLDLNGPGALAHENLILVEPTIEAQTFLIAVEIAGKNKHES